MECPRNGNECSKCLDQAAAELAVAYREKHPSISNKALTLVIERSKFEVPIQESEPLDDINCEDRQTRARQIGAQIGRTIR